MNEEDLGIRGFRIRIEAAEGSPGTYRIVYQPRGLQHERGPGGDPKRVPFLEYVATLRAELQASVKWEKPPADEKKMLKKFEEDARRRVMALHTWLEKVERLIVSVRGWTEGLGWAAKIVEKPMEDSEIGHYKAPALLLQEDTTRVLLEPVAREAPGSEGVVDLYLMPAYDDIASLYYRGNRWNIHYRTESSPVVGNIRNEQSKPLSRESLRQVLDEMKSHAA